MDLPEYLVAPERVRNMKAKRKREIEIVIANLMSAWNYSAGKFFCTYWINTKAFIMKKTQ
jgi:hypothetical protein